MIRHRFGALALVLAVGLAGCGGDGEKTSPATCDGIEAWAKKINEISNMEMGEGTLDEIAEMERLEQAWVKSAPKRIREAVKTMDSIDSDTMKIEEKKRADEANKVVDEWIRKDCGLDLDY